MQKLPTLGLLLLIVVGGCAEPPRPSQDSQAEENPAAMVRQEWQRRFNAKDAEGVAALYSQDATLAGEAGTLRGRKEIREWVQASIDQGSVLEAIEPTREKTSGTLAYGAGRSRRLVGEEIHLGQFLVVVEKIDGEWKIVQHFSMNVR